ncbi:MAG: serine hydrolase domain-containing protein [Desulfomonilaceae bacterium]
MRRAVILVWVLILGVCQVAAQPVDCDPPPEATEVTTGGWLKDSNRMWSFQHCSDLFNTAPVARGPAVAAAVLPEASESLDNLLFDDGISFEGFMHRTHTDAIIILHNGKIIFERYENCMKPDTHHLLLSVSKSFVGLVTAVMASPSRGQIDERALVKEYVPELGNSAYCDATLRQVMDMSDGVQFSEKYDSDKICNYDIGRYLEAAGWFACPRNIPVKSNLCEFLVNWTDRAGPHGEKFCYKSPNADVLAWVITKKSNKSLSQLVSEMIWSKIGADSDAYYLVDSAGKEAAFGGLNVTLRDLARFGQMMLQMGYWNGEQVVPKTVVEDIMNGGDPEAFAHGCEKYPAGSYRSQWWATHNKNGAYFALGVHGQWLYIDPTAQMVVAKFGSQPDSSDASDYELNRGAFDTLATFLTK